MSHRRSVLFAALLVACDAASAGAPIAPDGGAATDAWAPADPPAAPVGPLSLNDVSVLFPLPDRLATKGLLGLDVEAAGGPLLSRERFSAIAVFADPPDPRLAYESFRVVALRADPCFPDLHALETDPSACRTQLRLVAQPLADRLDGTGTGAVDSAIHLLYDLDAATFESLVDALVDAAEPDPEAPLGIDPTMARDGLLSSRGSAMRALITTYAGAATLAQLTFVRGDDSFTWRFGGLRVQPDGSLQPIEIHGIDPGPDGELVAQQVRFDFGPTSVTPSSDFTRALEPLFGTMSDGRVVLAASRDLVRDALAAALEIESPDEHHPDDVDCASCHVAGPLRERAELLGHSADGLPRFASTLPLRNSTAVELRVLPSRVRAFGYFREEPVISQRTINETAAVVEILNARRR